MKCIQCALIVCIFLSLIACNQIQKVTDIVVQPTAREVYARDFKETDTLFARWNASLVNAKINQLQITSPFTLQGNFTSKRLATYGYKVELQEGERLMVEVSQELDSSQVFIDVLEYENDSTLIEKPIVASEIHKTQVTLDVGRTSHYKIIVQPEIANRSTFTIKIYTQSMFSFPVSGYENKAVQSFWGAQRDAGKRSHEGVDIFAKRGTPVVAVTDGLISYAGEKGLGGKQVWQRAGLLGKSIYYAHLDSIAVSGNKRVTVGDTLGFVGNTGNAKTTNPHLHFGIYTNRGAINPLPFIKISNNPDIKEISVMDYGTTKKRNNELRIGPDKKASKIIIVAAKKEIDILGKTLDWYHVKLGDSLEGFMHESSIQEQEF